MPAEPASVELSAQSLMTPPAWQDLSAPDAYWRSLQLFNIYRAAVALLLLVAASFWGETLHFGSRDMRLFLICATGYAAFALAMFAIIRTRERFAWQLTIHVGADIGFVILLMYASGGLASGLGLLLLTSLAAAGLVSHGRRTLFFAAVATIAVLLEHTFEVLHFSESGAQYAPAGLLSVAYFAIAWVAHVLATRSLASERLAAQREIALVNMAQVNQTVIQEMEYGVIVVDGEGIVRQTNTAARWMIDGLSGGVIALEERAPALYARFKSWLDDEHGWRAPDTFDLGASLRARLVPVASQRRAGAVIFLEDLARIQVEARAMKLAALGRLTANIAHEIRNPLGAISHAAELLQEEPDVSTRAQRLAAIIQDNTRRLDRMINNVQTLNRGERAIRERVHLRPYLDAFIEQFVATEKLDAQLIELDMTVDPHVMFDPDHLNQVLWNLFRNASRHSRRIAGSIRLVVGRRSHRSNAVRLDVIDDGPGVPSESRGKLFEPFFTTAPGGMGLGLYLAREICEANGAALEYVEAAGGAWFSVICATD